jgi:hypothetical protein
MQIFVDTNVWWNWFSSCEKTVDIKFQQDCESFAQIFELVSNSSGRAIFLYNSRIKDELPTLFSAIFDQLALPFSLKVPIPLTRIDGAFRLDGSFLFGGRMGGTLRNILTESGYPQEDKILESAKALKSGENLFDKKPRKREFDIEHMESALEANANFFLTVDQSTILLPLRKMALKYESSHPINQIERIAFTPTEALPLIKTRFVQLENQ